MASHLTLSALMALFPFLILPSRQWLDRLGTPEPGKNGLVAAKDGRPSDRRPTRMIQMIGTRHRPILAVAALATMALALAGCGRKGPLEPPPFRATTDAVVTTDAPPTVTPVL